MILHERIPYAVEPKRPLPGVAPLDMRAWLMVDEVYAAQMARREDLLRQRRGDVLAAQPGSEAAQGELLDLVLRWLPEGFSVAGGRATRPDGVEVAVERNDPLGTLGRLVQEDFCLMEKAEGEAEHRLTAGVLCFPAGWTLTEKLGRPLMGVHSPVPDYNQEVGRRVQRLFNGLQPGRPLWRWNAHRTDSAELWLAMTEEEAHGRPAPHRPDAGYLRSERQVLVRLPETRAVVFSIHTFLVECGGARAAARPS